MRTAIETHLASISNEMKWLKSKLRWKLKFLHYYCYAIMCGYGFFDSPDTDIPHVCRKFPSFRPFSSWIFSPYHLCDAHLHLLNPNLYSVYYELVIISHFTPMTSNIHYRKFYIIAYFFNIYISFCIYNSLIFPKIYKLCLFGSLKSIIEVDW